MKDHLLDLVGHTHDLGCIDLVRITGSDTETKIEALAEDRSVVVQGMFAAPVAEFMGTFGMPNLGKLKIMLNLQEYRENAVMNLGKNAAGEPESINFQNATRDFKNSYRFMASTHVNAKLKTLEFKGVPWVVEFSPTVAAIQRFKMQAQAMAEEVNFLVKTENGDLKFYFGDHSTHAGNFVFEPGVTGVLKRTWSWPIKTVISILDLAGDKTFRISDSGAAMITVDSGLATYNYILLAQTK
jgi:hypothetical protein